MVKGMVGLIPLGLGVALYGAFVWFLLGRNVAVGSWLFAGFLFGHGLVHVMFVLPRPAGTEPTGVLEYPFDLSRSWLVSVGLESRLTRAVGVGLVIVVVSGYTLAGLSTVGLLVPQGWWQALVVGSTAASVALLVVAFTPALALGFAIDAVLMWIAFTARWSPGGSLPAITGGLG